VHVQAPFVHVGVLPPHILAAPHVPVASHVSTPLPEHCVFPGVQATQAPLRHCGVDPEQVWTGCHLPVASQRIVCWPEHSTAPGTHTPEQLPAAHANGHAVPETHWPAALHVCGVLPMH
jgi:hypothetical protein